MTWFRVDDGFCDHPKTLQCSLAAVGLWTRAGAWCSKHLTDGKVPTSMLRVFGATARIATELVAAGLWQVTPSGYEFHQWSQHQPSRSEVESKRLAARERMKNLRVGSPSVRANKSRKNREVREPMFATPVPSRPVPEEAEQPPPPEIPRIVACVSAEEVRDEWHDAAHRVVAAGSISHALTHWREDFEHIAAACNRESHPIAALRAVCAWFWQAPTGPVQDGRVRRTVKPDTFAKYVDTDLEAAHAWWFEQQREAAQ